MYSESEVRDDMEKLRAHVEALINKYGDDFSCVLSAGASIGDAWAGSCLGYGESHLMHQACHGLLENPKFIDEFFDAVICVLMKSRSDRSELLKVMMRESLEGVKRMLIMETEHYKKHMAEKDADEAVQALLKQTGFKN